MVEKNFHHENDAAIPSAVFNWQWSIVVLLRR
jgi:hypothetical protein